MRVLLHYALWGLGLAQAETQTTEAERDCLSRHASDKKRLAEIGVWHGVTTIRLRRAMASDGMLFAVDPYTRGRLGFSMQYAIAHREVSRIPNGSVRWIRKTGADAARDLAGGGAFDFVFIDADHTYEGLQADWAGWSPLLGDSGVIGLHDSRSTPQRPIDAAGSVRFTRDVVLKDQRFEVIDAVDSLTVLRRRSG